MRIEEFDTWRPGYAGATVTVLLAGTSTPASIYTDENLTVAASNPQTLQSRTVGGVNYGKFSQPLYVGVAFELQVDGADRTGVVRVPLTTLAGQDASKATVIAAGGTETIEIEDVVARTVDVRDYGEFRPVSDPLAASATNNATLEAAIGAAAANGGGYVELPAGTFAVTTFTLSAGVMLRGRGRTVTFLQSQSGANVATLNGDDCGFVDLTLDGVSLVSGSVGVYLKGNDRVTFIRAEVKRFRTGIHCKGHLASGWQDLFITNCGTGAKLHGDTDAGGGGGGGAFRDNLWVGGKVSQCSAKGLDLSYEDQEAGNNSFRFVGFEDNTGTAVAINGARNTEMPGCWWSGNTVDLTVQDDDDTDVLDNTVIGLRIEGGRMSGGTVTFSGTCQDVVFDRVAFSDVDFTLTLPINNILWRDCTEDAAVTIAGDGTRIVRQTTTVNGASSGITTDATATKAWSVELAPGQIAYAVGRVLGNQRNGVGRAAYHIAVGAYRPGSTLAYEAQTANFTVGDILTGGTSGATARITADSDSGTTGTLTLRDIVGAFEDGETITDGSGGSADANGTLVEQNVSLDTVGVTSLRTAYETDAAWNAVFVANVGELELRVTGAASKTIEWLADVEVTLS